MAHKLNTLKVYNLSKSADVFTKTVSVEDRRTGDMLSIHIEKDTLEVTVHGNVTMPSQVFDWFLSYYDELID